MASGVDDDDDDGGIVGKKEGRKEGRGGLLLLREGTKVARPARPATATACSTLQGGTRIRYRALLTLISLTSLELKFVTKAAKFDVVESLADS